MAYVALRSPLHAHSLTIPQLQRSEVLGALVNGVFLVALCVSIFLEAIQRFFEPQVISNPMLILIVGCCGLGSNIVGLFLFHDHGHSHGEHSEEGHTNHDHLAEAEEGQSNGVLSEADKKLSDRPNPQVGGDGSDDLPTSYATGERRPLKQGINGAFTKSNEDATAARASSPPLRRSTPSSFRKGHRRHPSSTSRPRLSSFEEIPSDPASFRNKIIQAGQLDPIDSGANTDAEPAEPDSDDSSPTEGSALLRDRKPPYSNPENRPHHPPSDEPVSLRRSASIEHHLHKHRQPQDSTQTGTGHGHSHGDLNMRGVFLHVLGDALGNVGVIASALFIWLTAFPWRFYADPLISLLITLIILKTALPLCRASARILLQAVPAGLSVDDIRDDIEALPGVDECHHLHVWQLSGQKLIASLHVRLTCDFPGCEEARGARQYMRLAKAVRTCLHEYGIHSSTIQPEFCLDAGHAHTSSASPQLEDGADGASGSRNVDASGERCTTRPDLRLRTPGRPAGGSCAGSGSGSPQDACLLECDERCSVKKCCVPDDERK